MQFNRHLKFKAWVKAWVKDEVKGAFRKALEREMVKAWVKKMSIESPPRSLLFCPDSVNVHSWHRIASRSMCQESTLGTT